MLPVLITDVVKHSVTLRRSPTGNVSRDHVTSGTVGQLSRRVGVNCLIVVSIAVFLFYFVLCKYMLYIGYYYISSVSQSCFFSIYTINTTSSSQNISGVCGRP